ncbi:HNH endonuclease [Pseudomonas sp. SC11]|uniref:HNH endonuclease n=1 Tax=Pseudomonas sp. SC11 TaxID=326927 RepID=UPI00399C1F76
MALDGQGLILLTYLVDKLPQIAPGRPQGYVGYKQIHEDLGLALEGRTYGESLQVQGLNSLAEWTADLSLPAITGLIIDRDPQKMRPGPGYFTLFGQRDEDYPWWESEIRKAKGFDWAPFIANKPLPVSPPANDLSEPPDRVETTMSRIIRDSLLSRRIKQMNDYKCQLCRHSIKLPNGLGYAEAHHLQPLGSPHDGPDIEGNVICLCPNCHVELDYGIRSLRMEDITIVAGHVIDERFIKYHNVKCVGQ